MNGPYLSLGRVTILLDGIKGVTMRETAVKGSKGDRLHYELEIVYLNDSRFVIAGHDEDHLTEMYDTVLTALEVPRRPAPTVTKRNKRP